MLSLTEQILDVDYNLNPSFSEAFSLYTNFLSGILGSKWNKIAFGVGRTINYYGYHDMLCWEPKLFWICSSHTSECWLSSVRPRKTILRTWNFSIIFLTKTKTLKLLTLQGWHPRWEYDNSFSDRFIFNVDFYSGDQHERKCDMRKCGGFNFKCQIVRY